MCAWPPVAMWSGRAGRWRVADAAATRSRARERGPGADGGCGRRCVGERARQPADAGRIARGGGARSGAGGSLVMGDQDVRVQAESARGRWRIARAMAATGGNNNGNTGWHRWQHQAPASMRGTGAGTSNGSGAGASTETAASTQSVGLRQRADAASRPRHPVRQISARAHLAGRGRRRASTTAGARLQSGQAMGIRAGEGVTLAGSALSDTRLSHRRGARAAPGWQRAGLRRHAAIGGQ